jgi:hypothetical protein
LDDSVIRKRDSLLVNFSVSSLKNELADGISGWISESDVRLDSAEEISRSFIDADKDTVMNLSESQNSKDSDDLGVQFVDTSDSYDESKAGLGWDVNLPGDLGVSTSSNLGLLSSEVISLILLGTLEDRSSLALVFSSSLLS